jgi:hypothetical protein
MPTVPQDITILALDLRLQRFGYAVLEGPHKLLTWGISTYRTADTDGRALLARKRISPLLTMFKPSIIVAKHICDFAMQKHPRHYEIVQAIEHEGELQSAKLLLFGRKDIKRAFGRLPETTKDAIAAQVALRFPELTWKLPPTRKTWMSEHHNMPIFDAVAVGLTYIAGPGNIPPPLQASSIETLS